MALAINIEDLLNKQKNESNRIEIKKGWNPVSIYHSVCALVKVNNAPTPSTYLLQHLSNQNFIKIGQLPYSMRNTILPSIPPLSRQ
jgi:hypothetical protein